LDWTPTGIFSVFIMAACATWIMHSQLKPFMKLAIKVNYPLMNVITLGVSILSLIAQSGLPTAGVLICGGLALQLMIDTLDAPPFC